MCFKEFEVRVIAMENLTDVELGLKAVRQPLIACSLISSVLEKEQKG